MAGKNSQPTPFSGSEPSTGAKISNELIFYSFFHPYTSEFIRRLNEGDIEKLLESDTVSSADDPKIQKDNYATFNAYAPSFVNATNAQNEIDFNYKDGTP